MKATPPQQTPQIFIQQPSIVVGMGNVFSPDLARPYIDRNPTIVPAFSNMGLHGYPPMVGVGSIVEAADVMKGYGTCFSTSSN